RHADRGGNAQRLRAAAPRAAGAARPRARPPPAGPHHLARDGRARADDAGRAAHAARGRKERPHERADGAHRGVHGGRSRALGRLVHAPVRADPDARDRRGHRRRGAAHVHADPRARRSLAVTLDADTIRTARGEAARSGRRVLDVLEGRSRRHAGDLIARLAGTLGYRAATMADLERSQSAFDVLPYADAARRGCAPVRGAGGQLARAFGDPFAADLRAWAEERIAEPFEWLLAHPADLAVYLARHE